MDDAIRGNILRDSDVPSEIGDVIGYTTRERLDCFIHDIVNASFDQADIRMSDEVAGAMKKMREFMFERVYQSPVAKAEEHKAEKLVETLFEYFVKHKDEMPQEFLFLIDRGEPVERVTCDYIGAMTDRFAIALYEEIFIPKSWQ